MKRLFVILFLLMSWLGLSSAKLHKYYVSVSQLEYVEDQKSLQVISRIFIDDFEKMLRERYDESITLAVPDEAKIIDEYVERYMKQKFVVQIDGRSKPLSFIGKEYDNDIMYVYFEFKGIDKINSLEISNETLFEIYPEQQNIIRTKIYNKPKSFILIKENAKGVLNFN